MFQYDEKFYELMEQIGKDEKIIVPKIIKWLSPKSIVDFGCGEGIWLKEVLLQNKEIDILGIDGNYINQERLKIPKEKFKAANLCQSISLGKKFDLAISTEVAEHLEEKYANVFLDNIVNSSDQILFSAAIPGQTGMHHVNEQWQSYWVSKFEKRGYYCDYSVRNYFWNESEINSWRKQNLLFFSKKKTNIAPTKYIIDVVHPGEFIAKQKMFNEKINDYTLILEKIIKLDLIIEKLLKQNKKIVIYPYGFNGHLCEKIFLQKYDKKDYLIADNIIKIKNKKIVTAKQLKKINDEISVIDTCSNPLIHEEVLNEIKKYVDIKNIYIAFKEMEDLQ